MMPMRPSYRVQQESVWARMRADFNVNGQFTAASENLARAAEVLQETIQTAMVHLDQAIVRNGRIMALCPFHDDRHVGSFFVDPRTGWYRCFACDSRGGLFKLLHQMGLDDAKIKQATQGVDFRALADFIEGPRVERSHVEDMTPLPESLLRLYDRRPLRLVQKGHPTRLIDAMEIGFDERRRRITFPVRRVTGELVAIQTRAAENDDPQRWKFYRSEIRDDLGGKEAAEALGLGNYIPPRTAVFFNEHNVLAGMLSGHVRKPVVLTEGPGHALRVLECGFPCLGSFGVSLAEEQLDRLLAALERVRRWTASPPRLIVATDGDRAGRMSAFRTTLRVGARAEVRIARIPRGKDPEDLSVGDLRPLLLGAEPFAAYRSGDSEDADWAIEAVLSHAKAAVDAIDRAQRKEKYLQRKEAESSAYERPGSGTLPFPKLPSNRGLGARVPLPPNPRKGGTTPEGHGE